jgi:hypothetical protein
VTAARPFLAVNKLLLLVSCFAFLAGRTPAAAATPLEAARLADDSRVAALIADDPTRLAAILSDDLRYAHSSGFADTKASYLAALAKGRTKHPAIDYEERQPRPASC